MKFSLVSGDPLPAGPNVASAPHEPHHVTRTWPKSAHPGGRNGVPARPWRQAACARRAAHAAAHAARPKDGVSGAHMHAATTVQRPRLHQACVKEAGSRAGGRSKHGEQHERVRSRLVPPPN